MRRHFARLLAFLLVLAMLASILPAGIFAAEEKMLLTVVSSKGRPGETVDVNLELSNNTGISSIVLNIEYDSVLTLKNVKYGENFTTSGAQYDSTPTKGKEHSETLTYISTLEDTTANGTFATLTFEIAENASDKYKADITVTYDEDDIFDEDFNNVPLSAVNGNVTVYIGIPGDINGDTKVNTKDAILLFRYVAGRDVDVDTGALDVNGNGKVNTKDAILLFRYVAGKDVTIVYPGTSDDSSTDPSDTSEIKTIEATGGKAGENKTGDVADVTKKYIAVSYTMTAASLAGDPADNGCCGLFFGADDSTCIFIPYEGGTTDTQRKIGIRGGTYVMFGSWWGDSDIFNGTASAEITPDTEVTVLVLGVKGDDGKTTVTAYLNGTQINVWGGDLTATGDFNGQIGWATELSGQKATVKFTESDDPISSTVFDKKVQNFTYTVNDDGTSCTITGLTDKTLTAVTIPSTIDGYTVTAI